MYGFCEFGGSVSTNVYWDFLQLGVSSDPLAANLVVDELVRVRDLECPKSHDFGSIARDAKVEMP